MKQFYTYLHSKPNGDIFYVGKGSGKRSHDFTCGRSRHHKNIVAKYGKENILVFVFPCDSEAQALADEVQQIAQLRLDGYDLCNISSGGDGGATGMIRGLQSAEHKAKQSAAMKLIPKIFGRKQSKESKEKIKAARARQVIRKWTDEERAAISERMKGNTRGTGSLGQKRTDEAKAKMSAAKMGNKYALGHDGSGTGRPKKQV